MINENRLAFGFGDIGVGANSLLYQITFQSFKPPTEVGGIVPDGVEYYDDKITIKLTYEKYNLLRKYADEVLQRKRDTFVFDGYTFDFSFYKEASVNVLLDFLYKAMKNYFFCMAC